MMEGFGPSGGLRLTSGLAVMLLYNCRNERVVKLFDTQFALALTTLQSSGMVAERRDNKTK